MKKSFLAKIVAGIFALAFLLPIIGLSNVNASADTAQAQTKIMDMYLIAGQSNAAGYSPVSGNQTETFENVWYAGQTEKTLTGANHSDGVNSDFTQEFGAFRQSVKAGYGATSGKIGPEYGIAQVINDRYAGEEKSAMIFKTAAGGTSLLDNTLELSKQYGNWYPRSLWESGYEPDISRYSATNDPTGILYKLFVENFKRVYNELVDNGYTPVVKGMAWMQGETNLYANHKAYGDTLKTFIADIRADLVEITGDNTLLSMPFVIGKICPSFGEYNNPFVPIIHQQQERVAEEMGNSVAVISTDDLHIVGEDDEPMPGCPDKYHFSFADAKTLGQRFGHKLLELCGQRLVAATAQNGKINYELNADDTVTFTLTPNAHYKLQSLTVGGVDVTAQVVDGKYTLGSNDLRVSAEAVFVEKDKIVLTYADLGKGAGYLYKARYWYEGEILSVKIFVNEGYTLGKVTYNGTEMTYNEQTGEYEAIITQEGEIAAEITKIPTQPSDSSSSLSSAMANGCQSVVGAGGAVALLLGVAVVALKKRKNK